MRTPPFGSGAHPLGDPLDLARARARGVHLGHGRRQGPVGPLVAVDDVLGEEAVHADTAAESTASTSPRDVPGGTLTTMPRTSTVMGAAQPC